MRGSYAGLLDSAYYAYPNIAGFSCLCDFNYSQLAQMRSSRDGRQCKCALTVYRQKRHSLPASHSGGRIFRDASPTNLKRSRELCQKPRVPISAYETRSQRKTSTARYRTQMRPSSDARKQWIARQETNWLHDKRAARLSDFQSLVTRCEHALGT